MVAVLKFLFSKFWPVLVPIIVYFLWLYIARLIAKKKGDELPGYADRHLKILGLVVLAVFVICAGYVIYSQGVIDGDGKWYGDFNEPTVRGM